MSSVNKILKQARSLIPDDPDDAINLLNQALSIDPKNTNTLLLFGKCYILKEDFKKAESSLLDVIKVDPNNLSAWKGYFSINKNNADYVNFLKIAAEYSQVLVNTDQPTYELSNQVLLYFKKQNSTNTNFLIKYYQALIPGTPLAENCGNSIIKPIDALEKLLTLKLSIENEKIKKESDTYRLKFDKVTAMTKIKKFKFDVYTNSDIKDLYESLINLTHDDEKRELLEEDLLKYKYQYLQVIDEGEIKVQLQKDILKMVNDMVLINHPSFFAWKLYFNLNDFKDLRDVEVSYIINFIQRFNGTSLANVFYAYIGSDISPFDKKVFKDLQKELYGSKKKSNETQNDDEEEADVDVTKELQEVNLIEKNSNELLSNEEVLSLLSSAVNDTEDDLLALMILSLYFSHIQEFENSLKMCKTGVDLLIKIKSWTGLNLPKSKQFFIIKLAQIYTHYEAPKNFPTAMRLYESILETYPDNSDAKVGKSLVFVQEGKLVEAEQLLSQVMVDHPDNNEALLELSWCKIQLGELTEGRLGIEKGLKKIVGSDLKSYDQRSNSLWRIAESYLLEIKTIDNGEPKLSELLKKAFDYLMQSLKMNKNFPSAYTSLGIIYLEYYNDSNRALKCFYKAFELDVSQIISARYLAEDFVSKANWELAEILCNRMVSSEKVRRKLMSLKIDKSWPYRILGIAALEDQRGDKAVEWFQSAIRLSNDDIESWVGLGEAYLSFGRLESAIKVFNRAIVIDDSHWYAKYLLGISQCLIKEYEGSIETLQKLLIERPNEECIIIAMYESLISLANNFVEKGFYGRAIECCDKVIVLLDKAANINIKSSKLWKNLNDIINIYLTIQSKVEEFPFKQIFKILEIMNQTEIDNNSTEMELINKVDQIDQIDLKKIEEFHSELNKNDLNQLLCGVLILISKNAIKSLNSRVSKILKANNWYNCGLSYLISFFQLRQNNYRDCAIECFKRSIKLNSSSPEYWSSLGITMININPRISQHCFIKATTLDQKNGQIWSNLAILYLIFGDIPLAKETFNRAQSISPDFSSSWIGEAIMNAYNGDLENSSRLFSHALVLSNGRSPIAQLMYGFSIINSNTNKALSEEELMMAHFSMERYLKQKPNDSIGLRIACNISERIGDYHKGEFFATKLCNIWENSYEKFENYKSLVTFANSKTQLSRFNLGNKNYSEAIENANFVLDILEDEEEKTEVIIKIILSSRIVLGLSYYLIDDFAKSIEEFKKVLKNNNDNSLIILISQALYNYNDDETKQAALDELFECITENGTSLITLFTLSSISLIENDEQILSVIKEELESLSLEELIKDSKRNVPRLVNYISARLNESNDSLQIWQRFSIYFPNDYLIWKNIDKKFAANIGDTNNSINSNELSNLYAETGQFRFIQRSLILNPGNTIAYKMLLGLN